jgi:hypothetical protein
MQVLGVHVDEPIRNVEWDYFDETSHTQQQALTRAQKRLMASNPVAAKTNLSGELVFHEVPAGNYFVSNVEFFQIGDSQILWDLAVKVSGQGDNYVELSNDNAWINR